jgi:ketosteroid isomerase-like protein
MPDLVTQLGAFMAEYERAANSHDVRQVLPLIANDATYWFTDGSYRGREEIAGALARTFAAIHDEVYEIQELAWVVATGEHAACRYLFSWRGVVDGQPSSGRGRGTNVLVRRDGDWQVQHEHLSH